MTVKENSSRPRLGGSDEMQEDMQRGDGGQGEDGKEPEAEHHNSVKHLYSIGAIRNRCSEMNITLELFSDLRLFSFVRSIYCGTMTPLNLLKYSPFIFLSETLAL